MRAPVTLHRRNDWPIIAAGNAMIDFRLQKFAFVALAAATLFGISTPLAKVLLTPMPGQAAPVGLAGLLYLGSGFGLLITRWVMRRSGGGRTEAAPARAD